MVLVLIGIAIGILIVAVLIIKTFKTPSHEIVGMDIHCKKCGIKTNGLACPKCEKKSQSLGFNSVLSDNLCVLIQILKDHSFLKK